MTYSEQLEQVRAAIAAIETGAQSYTIMGRTYNRADLRTLYGREERLVRLAAREARGTKGARMRYGVPK